MKPFWTLLALGMSAVALAAPARAQNYPWCANFADGAGVNCGFSTYQQCMVTSQGSGGYCTKNNLYTPPRADAPASQATRKRRPHPRS